jgi:hypothetical protein
MLSAAETSVVLAAVCSNQSASANALHQPFGLISPSTTLQDLGGSNNVQVAHMRTSFGLSWYSASFFDIFSRARTQDIAADANQAATLANAARSSLRRKTRLSVMAGRICNVCFTPQSGHGWGNGGCLLCAKSCREQVQQKSAIEGQLIRSPHRRGRVESAGQQAQTFWPFAG